MDLNITDEQKALTEAVSGVLARHGNPASNSGVSAEPAAHDPKVWEALVEVGVPALPWSEEDGGVGAGFAELTVAAAEVGKSRIHLPLAETVVAGAIITRTAPDSLRRELIGALAEGSALPVPALDEPMRAWSPTAPTVRAEGSGESWTLTGTKAPVRFAQDATHVVVSADTGSGTGLFLVTDVQAKGESLTFEGTSATLLADGEQAEQALAEALALGGAVLCGEALGAMEEALGRTTEYLRTRKQFGMPLAAFQALTHRAADMYAELELARSAALFAAMVADDDPVDVDAIARCRSVVDRAGKLVGEEAIQMHGGVGVTAEYAVGHLTARLTQIARTWGTPDDRVGELAAAVGGHESISLLG
ncbi:acyl-CoA dehydrogenase family protein [Marihabitans asiaticum]|uniref:Acyl-CoA dehydrogenase n=1 Tax=Marihabitans asiaticum TaxID=415218 RepID=A0A560WEG7_9MICO|nr:acyl-CoA dehydrogenase family protein [Marihabitans asiaticum]TWD15944.1 hypothetical protein FB557_1484 [Marihabitans asiaticum]